MSRSRPRAAPRSVAAVLRASAMVARLLLLACGPRPPPLPAAQPVVAGDTWGAWRTLRSVHRGMVEVRSPGGGTERHPLRGVVAVERPGSFRLRALGPGGITLFDLLYRDGRTDIIRAVREPQGEAFGRLLGSIAGDLAAAFDLRPRPAGRRVRVEGSSVVVAEPGRTVWLRDFRETGRGPAPAHLSIDDPAGGYRVEIDATETALDVQLDAAMFEHG